MDRVDVLVGISPCRQIRKTSLLTVAAFAVCIFARMRLPVCEHPAVTFGSSAHGSLLRAKFQSFGEIKSIQELSVYIEILKAGFAERKE